MMHKERPSPRRSYGFNKESSLPFNLETTNANPPRELPLIDIPIRGLINDNTPCLIPILGKFIRKFNFKKIHEAKFRLYFLIFLLGILEGVKTKKFENCP